MKANVTILDHYCIAEKPGPDGYRLEAVKWEENGQVFTDILKDGCGPETPHREGCSFEGRPITMLCSCICRAPLGESTKNKRVFYMFTPKEKKEDRKL